jgi:subtilisin family serine protease
MRIALLLAATTLCPGAAASAQSATAQANGGFGKIANQYICSFDGSVSPSAVQAETGKAIGRTMGEVLHVYDRVVRGFAARFPAAADGRSPVAELRANNPRVAGCEQDQIVKAFVAPPRGGATGQTTPPGLGGPGTPATGRTAWVIDSGVDLDHPDLNVLVGLSKSFVRDSSADDFNGHGTHVAGTIGAIQKNNIGVVGVAPGAPIVSVRVLDRSGSGSTSGVIAGVNYLVGRAKPGDVANMSLGGGVSDMLDKAVMDVAATGIHFTLAAGNESDNAANHSPARANGKFIYTVSAIDSAGRLASFSNYGLGVDWAEPGVNILSTYKNGGYTTMSGTSMAAPHLAGILMVGGVVGGGTITGDRDEVPDPIGVRAK